jgi:hypothetical protein
MKLPHFLPALALLALTACSTTPAARRAAASPTGDTPETVMVTYHVQPGREADFPALLCGNIHLGESRRARPCPGRSPRHLE